MEVWLNDDVYKEVKGILERKLDLAKDALNIAKENYSYYFDSHPEYKDDLIKDLDECQQLVKKYSDALNEFK